LKAEVFELTSREEFCRQAAELMGAAGTQAVADRGRFLLVLTGGRTVQPIYRHLAAGAGIDLRKVLAAKTFFFWGDERWVPPTHPDSNQGLARRLFLDTLSVPEKRLRPVATGLPDPLAGARAYEQSLQDFFGEDLSSEGWPVFDLILLGLGPDGHVASLFPNSSALAEQRRWVSKVSLPELTPRVARVTLTLPVLNRARLVVVLAAGGERVDLARRIIEGESGKRIYPAAGLHPDGRLVWLLAEGN
jgi:6-phosphogluconolactonase